MSETILERTSDSHYANLSALMFLGHYDTAIYSKIEKCQENCYQGLHDLLWNGLDHFYSCPWGNLLRIWLFWVPISNSVCKGLQNSLFFN